MQPRTSFVQPALASRVQHDDKVSKMGDDSKPSDGIEVKTKSKTIAIVVAAALVLTLITALTVALIKLLTQKRKANSVYHGYPDYYGHT